MPRIEKFIALGFMLIANSIATSSTAQEPKTPDSGVSAGQAISVSDAATSPEMLQESSAVGRSSDIPPVAPQVSYIDGKLTIIAENCSLGDILAAIRKLTGVRITMPAKGSEERMAAHVGPGTPRDVLTEFLYSTKFNFIMQSADDSSDEIQSILLMPRGKAPNRNDANVRAGSSSSLRQSIRRRSEALDSSSNAEVEQPVSPQSATNAVEIPQASSAQAAESSTTTAPATTGADLRPTAAAPTEDNSQSISPSEQMIDGLRRLYEQRRQMQQEQNSKASQNNPPQ